MCAGCGVQKFLEFHIKCSCRSIQFPFTSVFSFRLSIPTLFGRSSDHTSVTLFIQQAGFLNFITYVGSNYRTGIRLK